MIVRQTADWPLVSLSGEAEFQLGRATRIRVLKLCLLLLFVFSPNIIKAAKDSPKLIPQPESGEPQLEILAIELNGESISIGSKAYTVGSRIWLPAQILQAAKLKVAIPDNVDQQSIYIDPASLPFISQSLDSATRVLSLTAESAAFSEQRLWSSSQRPKPQSGINTFFLNYNATSTFENSQSQTNAFFEPGITLENSVINSSFLVTDLGGEAKTRRLETSWTLDFPERRDRLTIGDTFASQADGSSFGSNYRFGGLQWGTHFEIDPYFVHYPLPTIYGAASQRSTVDLYINESLRYRTSAEIGPFAIDQPPLTNGAGDIQIVVTDLTGRQTLITQPFYVSTRLLTKGLSDYQLNIGKLRESLITRQDSYGDGFAAGRYRYGLNEKVTGQVVAEWSENHSMGAVSAVTALPRLGVVSGSYALSESDAGAGAQFGLAFERNSKHFGIGIRASYTEENFQQLGFDISGQKIRQDWSASLRFSPWNRANVALLYTEREFHDDSAIEIVSLSYSQRIFDRTTLNVSARQITGMERSDDGLAPFRNEVFDLTFARSLGEKHVASVSHSQKNDRARDPNSTDRTRLSLRKSVPNGLGYGYRLAAEQSSQGGDERFSGSLDWHTRNASLRVDARKSGDFESVSVNAQGSLLLAKKNLFVERSLRDGFALVDLNGYADIGIYRENQLVTRTNKRGYAVVPELAPYVRNRVRIEANALPINASLAVDRKIAVPRFGGAIGMDFGIRREFAAVVVLHNEAGQVLPLGTQVSASESGARSVVAHRGEVYLKELDTERSFEATYKDQSCNFEIGELGFDEDTINRIGPIVCKLR